MPLYLSSFVSKSSTKDRFESHWNRYFMTLFFTNLRKIAYVHNVRVEKMQDNMIFRISYCIIRNISMFILLSAPESIYLISVSWELFWERLCLHIWTPPLSLSIFLFFSRSLTLFTEFVLYSSLTEYTIHRIFAKISTQRYSDGRIWILLVLFKWPAILSNFAQFRLQHCFKLFQVFYFCVCPFLFFAHYLVQSIFCVRSFFVCASSLHILGVYNIFVGFACILPLYQLHSNNHCFIQPFNFKFDDLSSTLLPFELLGIASNANIKL